MASLLNKTLNRPARAVVLPLRDHWVVALARQSGGRPQLEQLLSFERDGNDVAALKRIAAQFDLRRQALGTLLVVGEYQFLQADAPELEDRAELKEALRWKVKDLVDYPVAEATLDYFEIPPAAVGAGRGRQLFVAIADNRTLRPKIELFQDARLPLAVIDLPEMALRNVARLFESPQRGLALLNFTPLGGMLAFTFGGELIAVRRIEITLDQLEAAQEGRLAELFDRVALEVQRSVDNVERQFNAVTLGRLLTLDLPTVPGLVDYLTHYLSIKVEPLVLAEAIDFPTLPEFTEPRRQAALLPAIGAALRQEAD